MSKSNKIPEAQVIKVDKIDNFGGMCEVKITVNGHINQDNINKTIHVPNPCFGYIDTISYDPYENTTSLTYLFGLLGYKQSARRFHKINKEKATNYARAKALENPASEKALNRWLLLRGDRRDEINIYPQNTL